MRKYMQYLICQKKYPANSPQYYYYYYYFLLKTNAIWKENIICMARSNLMMPIQKKKSCSTCFFCLPQTVPAMLSQENKGHNKLVPRLYSKHTNITSKCASNQT
jgi:hypothetical protein